MHELRMHVGRTDLAAWDKLTAFLDDCARRGGTVCLWYDPMG